MEKIFLHNKKSKTSNSEGNTLGVKFNSPKRILPQDSFFSTINLIDVYNDERYKCNKIRLNCVIRPYCSNVLFNPFTEIVYNEGSNNTTCLNHENVNVLDVKPIYKKVNDFDNVENTSKSIDEAFRIYNLIEDTQLTSKKLGNLTYHCGLDFFNNHLLRSTTFKKVNPMKSGETSQEFNTMLDYHRHYDGSIVKEDTVKVGHRDFSTYNNKMHIYTFDDILTFNQCVREKLKEDNGWFGFINKTQLKMFDINNKNELFDISKPLNNKEACEFVDMYPDRTLFYFTPKYNNFRKRIEKNWNYLITYPFSSTTENIPFITNGALRLFLVDETYSTSFKMYSMSKHGLKEGDYINLYRDDVLLFASLQVTKIEDEFTFFVNKNGLTINSKFEVSSNLTQEQDISGITTYKIYKNNIYYYDLNSNFLTFSFKKLVKSKEVQYYVKLLTRLPNWKMPNDAITEKLIYDTWGGVTSDEFKKYQSFLPKHESKNTVFDGQFENHIAKLSFSRNIYNDDVSEIIFTDDIDINYLRDDLNRPLTNIYLTIIKNNKGYEKWYNENDFTSPEVEFSHCFSQVTCGFYLNPKMYDINYCGENNIYCLSNSRTLHYTEDDTFSGLTMDMNGVIGDEIKYEKDFYYFYGDLYSYSHETCEEELIQRIDSRFNTYQREYNCELRRHLNFSDIIADDYDLNGAWDETNNKITNIKDFLSCKSLNIGSLYEGYYYQQNYEIPIRTVSTELTTSTPKSFTIRKVEKKDKNQYTIFTNETNYLELNDTILFYEKHHDEVIDSITYAKVTEIFSHREFTCQITKKSDFFKPLENKKYYKILKIDKTVPNHAEIIMDGTCRLVWRDIIQNGFDKTNGSSIERYPFTNGRLYVMKDFNFFLKRQNPNNDNILTNQIYGDYNIDGNFIDKNNMNNYYNEKTIKC